MKRPFWRSQSQTWCVWLPSGKLKTLGPDPHGATRKNPPKEIVDAWHAVESQTDSQPRDMIFSDIAAKYIDYLTNAGTRQSTREHLDRFMIFIGKKMKISTLRVHHVNDFLKTREWSDSMKATAINRITSALNWAKAEGLIEDHKVIYAKGRKPRYARRNMIVTREQQHKLEEISYPAIRSVLAALRESGCRPNEICGVTIDKVDIKGRVMWVPNKTKKQTGIAERPVYLSPALAEIITKAIGSRTEGNVFLNSYGKPFKPPTISHSVRRLRIKSGLPKGTCAYGIRHNWFSKAINDSDANPALVARLGGHADLTMLLRTYFHEDPEAMKRAIDEITQGKRIALEKLSDS